MRRRIETLPFFLILASSACDQAATDDPVVVASDAHGQDVVAGADAAASDGIAPRTDEGGGEPACVPGCLNQSCPGTYDFCLADHGECQPVPCSEHTDCCALEACDDPAKDSVPRFYCDGGQCRRDKTEQHTVSCGDGPAPGTVGFGGTCQPSRGLCGPDLACLYNLGDELGYCTMACTVDADCREDPSVRGPGIVLGCTEVAPDERRCIFRCGQPAMKCPAGMGCRTISTLQMCLPQ